MSLSSTFKPTPTSILKNLIQTLHDGQEGFKKASENVKEHHLKTLFSQFSLQRSKFAGDLERELSTLGEADPQKEGSTVSGTIHRGWIDLKSALTGHDAHSILSEAERGEDIAVKAFRDALASEDLPANLREIITSQANEVQAVHNKVRELRDSTAK
jgi:uncharacterized protein (TIGR02284 family)